MGLRLTGTRQLIIAPKGEKGDKGDNGNSFRPKGRAEEHYASYNDLLAHYQEEAPANDALFLVDYTDGDVARLFRYFRREFVLGTVTENDAYTVASTKHLWVATGNVWCDFGEIQGPPGENGKDGEKGKDAELYHLVTTEAWARWEYNNSGERLLKCCIRGEAWFVKGNTRVSATSGLSYEDQRIRIVYNNGKMLHYETIAGDGSWTDGNDGKYMEGDVFGSSSVGEPDGIIVELIGKDISDRTTVIDSRTIAIVWDGEPGGKGNDGDMGPMGIPVGEYNDTARYERTKSIVPIVENNGEYWYPSNTGVLANSEPSSSNSAWKKAENFAVMFVKVFFAAFAKLGEAIFHGNWMFSQWGMIDGASSQEYKNFKGNDPMGVNAGNFAPNFAVDLLSGKAYLNDVMLRGSISTPPFVINKENAARYAGNTTVIDLRVTGFNLQINTDTYVQDGKTQRFALQLPTQVSYIGTECNIFLCFGRDNSTVDGVSAKKHILLSSVSGNADNPGYFMDTPVNAYGGEFWKLKCVCIGRMTGGSPNSEEVITWWPLAVTRYKNFNSEITEL